MIKVVKFGGSSVSSPIQFKKVKNIIESDNNRRIIVVSAVGKKNIDDYKITDLLYLCHAHLNYNINCDNIYNLIINKFENIQKELNIDFDIKKELINLKNSLNKNTDLDYLVSRGEYFTAILMSKFLNIKFIDAKDLIFFNFDGSINYEKTKIEFEKIKYEKIIIPGFYGSLPNGDIKIMQRGGGDVTGAIMANVANASIYENFTDVSGILMADPRIIDNPKEIHYISYKELRELSYMGANVLHEEAIFPVKEKGIPIHILNTNKPNNKGTIIKDEIKEENNIITGIAGKKDFSVITLSKGHMSNEIGLIRKALEIFEKYRISIEHIPSGVDSFSIVVETKSVKPYIYDIISELKTICKPDNINIMDNISLIATVGRNMKNMSGLSGRLFLALGKNNINISVISQTSDELNIIIGVSNNDYEKAIKTIYNEFIQ